MGNRVILRRLDSPQKQGEKLWSFGKTLPTCTETWGRIHQHARSCFSISNANLTPDRIRKASLPERKTQSFLRDATVKGLCGGGRLIKTLKVYIVQRRLQGGNEKGPIRVKLGAVDSITLEDARKEVQQITMQLAKSIDPRNVQQRQAASEVEERQENKRQDVTIGEAWSIYMRERESN